jgi:hypothetical protein
MLAPIVSSPVQRFTQSNLTSCGWFLHRLVKTYPNKNEIGWANYIRSMCGRNDCLFIAQPHGVALAEVVQTDNLVGKRVVYERFVWCEDRQNPDHVDAAADFYTEFVRWAVSLGIDEIVIDRASDVPVELIRATLRKKINVSEVRSVKV